ncbi:MAG: formyltransferase family protein [Gammaproteobacteria bacterium]|nr:formyltransferase family protein [Gammaproteobacteria bacterium]MDH5799882.1 formyltransferase family protein [Gammaproteobacteria bacterium]
MLKIAYCGYDFFHNCLDSLLTQEYDIYKVFSVDGDSDGTSNQYVLETCRKHSVPYTLEPINSQHIRELHSCNVDVIITAAYHYKVPELSNSGIRGINVHPTLLPVGRGVWPLPWIILDQHQVNGVSIHKLTNEWDAGDILQQQSFAVDANELLESLNVKCQLTAQTLLIRTLKNLEQYWEQAQKQILEPCWPIPSKEQRTLDWNKSVDELDRIARAFGKHGCFAQFAQQDWMVYSLKVWTQTHSHTPGSVVHKTNTEMVVAATDGLVGLLYFRPIN